MQLYDSFANYNYDATFSTFTNIGSLLLGALVILIIGLILSKVAKKATIKILETIRFDVLLEKSGINKALSQASFNINPTQTIGKFIKWMILLFTFIIIFDLLNLNQINDFLYQIALYIPNLVIAVIILIVGLYFGQFAHTFVSNRIRNSQISNAFVTPTATFVQWSIVIMTVLSSLSHLHIAQNLINIFFTGFMASLAIGLGLAVGLGAKDHVNEYIQKIKQK